MPAKKTDTDSVVSSVVSKDVVASPKKAAAKPRAKKTATATATSATAPKKPKAVTHRHKKQEATSEANGVAAPALTPEQIHDSISLIAYTYYEGRGSQPGSPDEDWVRAEQEFWSRFSK